ncbi:uncharacterized protein LOC124912999 [Impatiens glandulifera]|uniref:uncharacterized protein LOC124912999 n=1 Tax=Impatiens glandulifera TaxID=253017 RepID=UPI001FB06649|nr:uncharacterized protein LOC124912999 [Impatiens glandulifera]
MSILLRHGHQSFNMRRQAPTKMMTKSRSFRNVAVGKRLSEVAGTTAAECTAVWCCVPCTILDVVVMTVYKIPAGICRKTMNTKRRKRLLKDGGGTPTLGRYYSDGCIDFEIGFVDGEPMKSFESDKDIVELEDEMWNQFYGAGFWRSPSQRNC